MSRRFHVVPEFMQSKEFLIGTFVKSIDLQIESDHDTFIKPSTKMKIRKSYPNKNYYVAGAKDTKRGWLCEIPDGVQEFNLRFFWTVGLGNDDKKFMIIQNIQVKLLDEGPGLYSMCAMTWRNSPVAPVNAQLRAVGHINNITDHRKSADGFSVKNVYDDFMCPAGIVTNEKVEINRAEIDQYVSEEWLLYRQ